MFYGPGTWYDANGVMAEKVRTRALPATDGVMSFLHVEDAANAVLQALDWPTGPVNIVDDEPRRNVVAPVYAEAHAPAPAYQAGSKRGERGASNAKARKEYGWEPLHPRGEQGSRNR